MIWSWLIQSCFRNTRWGRGRGRGGHQKPTKLYPLIANVALYFCISRSGVTALIWFLLPSCFHFIKLWVQQSKRFSKWLKMANATTFYDMCQVFMSLSIHEDWFTAKNTKSRVAIESAYLFRCLIPYSILHNAFSPSYPCLISEVWTTFLEDSLFLS
jgi:hypothetical protein